MTGSLIKDNECFLYNFHLFEESFDVFQRQLGYISQILQYQIFVLLLPSHENFQN